MSEGAAVTIAGAAEQLGLTVRAGDNLERDITGAVVGDLLSYVMANGKPGQLWITIQTHPNTVAVAALAGLSGILIADGFQPEGETISRAEEEGIPLLTSDETAYRLAGKLYALGVQ